MKILGTLKDIRNVYDSIIKLKNMGVNTDKLLFELNIVLQEWKTKSEFLTISGDYICDIPKYYILSGMEWIPVYEGNDDNQGGIKWKVQYNNGNMDTGRSRVGKWAYSSPNGQVSIELSLESLSTVPLHRL